MEQGLRPGCVLATLLFNIFFAAVINSTYPRFKADKGIMDALVHLGKKRGAERRGEATVGESALATPLWGMLYADDAGVVSQSPEQLRILMGVIVVVCAAFDLTVSEVKTDIMCLRTKGMPESTATFSVEAAGQVYNIALTHTFNRIIFNRIYSNPLTIRPQESELGLLIVRKDR